MSECMMGPLHSFSASVSQKMMAVGIAIATAVRRVRMNWIASLTFVPVSVFFPVP